jgi:hypothetical protein
LLFFRADNDKLERMKSRTSSEIHAYQSQMNVAQQQNLVLIE